MTQAGFRLNISHSITAPYLNRLQTIGGEGASQIMEMILDRSNALFGDFRQDPVASRILFGLGSIQDLVSPAEAEHFGRTLIRLVSGRKGRLGFTEDVSPEADCLVLSYEGHVQER